MSSGFVLSESYEGQRIPSFWSFIGNLRCSLAYENIPTNLISVFIFQGHPSLLCVYV